MLLKASSFSGTKEITMFKMDTVEYLLCARQQIRAGFILCHLTQLLFNVGITLISKMGN